MNRLTTLDELIARQSPELQAAAHQRYLRLLQEEEDLKALRLLVQKSQAELAEAMGVNQAAVSKFERNPDVRLKVLRDAVRHLGGRVDIVVTIEGREPIRLSRLSDAFPATEDPNRDTPANEKSPRRVADRTGGTKPKATPSE